MKQLINFVLPRLAQGLVIVFLITFVIFSLVRLAPGDPARLVLGPMASDEAVEQASREMGLRDSIPKQYVTWVGGVVRGDLGRSYIRSKSGAQVGGAHGGQIDLGGKARVTELIWSALPFSLGLIALAGFLTVVVAIPLGLLAGRYPTSFWDKLAFGLGTLFVSLPNFGLAVVLALVITATLNWLPSIGYKDPRYAILPAIVIAVEMIPILMRATSTSVAAEGHVSYVYSARRRGLSERTIFWKHVVRNAMVPVLNLIGVQLGALLGSLFVIEYVFNYPGIGLLAVQAVLQRDFPVLQGVAVMIAITFIVVNIAVDYIAYKIDPRVAT